VTLAAAHHLLADPPDLQFVTATIAAFLRRYAGPD
jgi:hypothetical protein